MQLFLKYSVALLSILVLGTLNAAQTSADETPAGTRIGLSPERIASPVAQNVPTIPYFAQAKSSGDASPQLSTSKSSQLSFAAQSAGAQSAGCASGSSQPAPLVALASALKCDADLIFEYVYNNIEFEPLYGSNKGALGTLLDRRGDDAD
jgi:hypothetical protein